MSEFVTQYRVSTYYNSRNARKATSQYFLDCSSGQGTIIKVKWQLSSKCPSSYSTLKTSIASRIPTTTGALKSTTSIFKMCYEYFCRYEECRCFHCSGIDYCKAIKREMAKVKPTELHLFNRKSCINFKSFDHRCELDICKKHLK